MKLRYLRLLGDVPSDTVMLMVIDRAGSFKGSMTILDLIRSDEEVGITDIMARNVRTLSPHDNESEVAMLFENHDLIAATVVDEHDIFLG